MVEGSTPRSRTKRYHPKTRSGCFICRQRRVKCDERQPSCSGCRRNFVRCVYPSNRPAQFILDPHIRNVAPHLQFFIDQSLPVLGGVHRGWSKSLIPDVAVWKKVYEPFDQLWRVMTLQVAFSEPAIAQLASLYASRHRLAIEAVSVHEHDHYACMLSATKKALERSSPDIGAVAALIFFAYERLRCAASGDAPLDLNHAHMRVFTNMDILKKDGEVQTYLRQALEGVTAMLELFYIDGRNKPSPIWMPPFFTSCAEARSKFLDVINFHRSGEQAADLFKLWSSAMLQYHQRSRGFDQSTTQESLAMLLEFQLLRTMFDLSKLVQRSPTDSFASKLAKPEG